MALPDILARPFHLQELKDEFDTGGEWAGDTYTADLSTAKAAYIVDRDTQIDATNTALDALVDATTLSAGEKTALKDSIASELAALKTDLTTELNTNIPDAFPTPIVDALQEAYEIYVAEDEAANIYPCPQCSTNGKIPVYDATGTPTGDDRACPLSDGYCGTSVEYVADPNSLQYIPA